MKWIYCWACNQEYEYLEDDDAAPYVLVPRGDGFVAYCPQCVPER